MPLSSKSAGVIYFVSALVVLGLAIWFTFVSLIGPGWLYLIPTLIAVCLIVCGILGRRADESASAKLSGAGAILCALVLLGALAPGTYVSMRNGQFTHLIATTTVLLLPCAVHLYVLFFEYRDRQIAR